MNKPFFINHMMIFDPTKISNAANLMTGTSGNTGNSYISYSLVKELYNWNCDFKGIQNIWEYDYSKSEQDLDYINNEADIIFFNLQDHIRPVECQFPCNYEKLNKFIKQIKKQVNVIGIGANCFTGYDIEIYKRLPADLKDLLYTLADKANYIGVRGEFTANVLAKLGILNTKIIGCPTFYEMGSNHKIFKAKNINEKDIVLTNMYKLGCLGISSVVLQSEEDIMDAVFGNPVRFFQKDAKYDSFWEMYIKGGFKFFTSIHIWKEFLKKFKFAVGCRVHGGILAVNSGVPAVCLNADMRCQEMCDVLKIPCFPDKDNLNPMEIYECTDYDDYNKNYNVMYKYYVDFIKQITGITIFDSKQDIRLSDDINSSKIFTESFGKIAQLCLKEFCEINRLNELLKNKN